ncbi:MAG: hypothetical protein EAZ76_12695 [Nostocales cyanobacterium]|nr:MAG: hypothetical protein EAZ87_15855 [Nostocales cyanobacterium]TAF12978.1 MAG: hypothetical protein EAZ76_12695 [Nostocales cyanobacterium]
MNAFQPSQPTLQPEKQRRSVPRPKKHLRQRSYRILAIETSAKITVNLIIISAALSALSQLLPYHWLQQDKLREIRTEVKLMEGRVSNLKSEFSRNFDPTQANTIRQEQSYRFPRGQRQLIIINPDIKSVEESDSTP